MYKRFIIEKVLRARKDTPVVMIAGPRQCGKTTLVKNILGNESFYLSFDDSAQLAIAKSDPVGFIRNLPKGPVILDEIQRMPELFVSIKQSIDESRYPGRFLLTGSANALLIPQVSDSLAGRLEVINLLPLSECEVRDTNPTFLTQLLAQKPPTTNEIRIRESLIDKIVSGGFPEPLLRQESRRSTWYTQYLNSLIQKDLAEIANIEHLHIMPRFLKMLAVHAGSLLNSSELGASIEISRNTALRYLQLLERLFLVELLPAWFRNQNKQLTKSPKIHFVDTGLLCSLKRVNRKKISKDMVLFGHLLESYVYCELTKQASWLEEPLNFFHYRDKDKVEVDFVLEGPGGEIIGIEVKATATLRSSDFKGLIRLKEVAGKDFHIGILLYDGDMTTSFGENLYAVPIGALWK